MTMYRIRYSLYRVDASDAHDAKRKIVQVMKARAEDWISVEPERPKRGFWKTLLFGR